MYWTIVHQRTLSICLLLAACSGSEDVLDSGPGDSGTAADTGPTDSGFDAGVQDVSTDSGVCSLNLPSVTVPEGGLLDVQLELPTGTTIDAVSWPAGWRGQHNAGRLQARVAYDDVAMPVTTPASVGLTLSCGADQTLEVQVRSLQFSVVDQWPVRGGPEGPIAREHAAVFIDPQDPDQLVLFGGLSYFPQQFTVVNDVWRYDLVNLNWTAVTATGAPMRAAGRIATGGGVIAYHGGAGDVPDPAFDLELLVAEGDGFRFDVPEPMGATGDSYRLGALIYDTPRERFLSVCGLIGQPSCRVEAYYPAENRWANVPVDPSLGRPDGRYGHFAFYDEATERVIFFSGAREGTGGDPVNALGDTWALELASDPPVWFPLLADGTGPIGRRNGCSAFDPEGRRFFVWGGTPDARTTAPGLWVLELDSGNERWIQLQGVDGPVARSSCYGIYDPARKRILFGGGNGDAVYADWNALDL